MTTDISRREEVVSLIISNEHRYVEGPDWDFDTKGAVRLADAILALPQHPEGGVGELIERAQAAVRMQFVTNAYVVVPRTLYAELVSALSTAPKRAESEGGWRPIESAPRDGTHILACLNAPTVPYGPTWGFNHRPCYVVHYFPYPDAPGFYLSNGTGDLPPMNPTHWLPLPSPPETKP